MSNSVFIYFEKLIIYNNTSATFIKRDQLNQYLV